MAGQSAGDDGEQTANEPSCRIKVALMVPERQKGAGRQAVRFGFNVWCSMPSSANESVQSAEVIGMNLLKGALDHSQIAPSHRLYRLCCDFALRCVRGVLLPVRHALGICQFNRLAPPGRQSGRMYA